VADAAPSVGERIVQALEGLAKLAPEAVSAAFGLFMSARAAITTVASGIAAAATQGAINKAQARYTDVPISPPVLADMIVRNIVPDSTGRAGATAAGYPPPLMTGIEGHSASEEAAYSGISGDRFAAMVAETGEPYGVVDALRLWNRGQYMYALVPGPNYATGVPIYQAGENLAAAYGITDAELDKVIAYSRTRPEFTADLKKLAKNTLSPADAVEMAVKQIVPRDVARSLYEAAGGVGEQFDALVDAAGDSVGVEKAVELYAHGLISKGELEQAIGMSRMNPRFYYLATEQRNGTIPLNAHFLAPYEIRLAAQAGLVDQKTALRWLKESGYSDEQAAVFALVGAQTVLSRPKEETASMLLKEFTAGILTREQVTKALVDMGYVAESVPFLLESAIAAEIISARNAAVTRLRAAYLVRDINETTVRTELGALGLPDVTINAYLEDWGIEQRTPHMHLSAAQVGKLLGQGHISTDEALAKWQAMGYSATDANLLLYIYPAPEVTTPPAIVSAGTASAQVGHPFDFTVQATGSPPPVVSYTGALPPGLMWQYGAEGEATVAGVPSAGSAGTYVVHLSADNGNPHVATKDLTITVAQ
jgi:hypothetical protein